MYQHLYQRFIAATAGKQHFACHSHHFWPDCTREAMLDYWDDTAAMVDDKWDKIFGEVMPEVQGHIAGALNTGQPQQLVFAPNTHELVFRLLSCLDLRKPQTIVTTDSEFHSFDRQVRRLAEWDNITLVQVPVLPMNTFEERMSAAIARHNPDMLFFSQVFFNSGLVVKNPEAIVNGISNPHCIIVIDGYHGFMALPTDLSSIKDRVFYLAGGYKYAQSGEGCCFAHVPDTTLRPLYTGWFAEFGALASPKANEVVYSTNGQRFAGATMDLSAMYRMRAVFRMLQREGIEVGAIHHYVQQLQQAFLTQLDEINHPLINRSHLLVEDLDHHGHFLTFVLPDADTVTRLAETLRLGGIHTDHRGDRLRFGFALYQNAADFDLGCLRAG